MTTLVEHWSNGQVYCIINRMEGDPLKLHCADGPASSRWDARGRLVWQSWWVNNVRHRADGPALVELVWKDDIVAYQRVEWWYNGIRWREVGPALIVETSAPTHSRRECWYLDGFCYREKIIGVLRAC